MTKILPKDITSYDLLKTLAIITMVVDHIGAYFFPDVMWWRAVGRTSAPMWLFMIGYARTRDIPPRLSFGALFLVVASLFVSPSVFPMNILVGMVIVRMILDRVANYVFSERARLIVGCGVAVLLALPSYLLFDYGVLCLLVALCGYLLRWNTDQSIVSKNVQNGFIVFTAGLYVVMNLLPFEFNSAQNYFVLYSVAAVFLLLYLFKPTTYPEMTRALPKPVTATLQFCGRHSLEIYVGHLVLFKIAAAMLGIEGLGLFEWRWM